MIDQIRPLWAKGVVAALAGGAALVAVPGAALAQEAPGDVTISGNVALVSDYRFRGVSGTEGDPAVQGTINLNHSSGLYVGTWASSFSGGAVRGSQELDLYAGYTREVAPGFVADAGLLYYAFPSGHVGKAEFFEPYASVSTTYGPARIKLGANYAWAQAAIGDDDNIYVYSNVDVSIPTTPVTLSAHAGYQDGALSGPAMAGSARRHGWDYSLGASATVLGRVTLGVTYVGVDGPSVNGLTDDQIVGSLTVSF